MSNKTETIHLIKVASTTPCSTLCGAIINAYEKVLTHKDIVLRSVGAGGLNQSVKSVISANRILKEKYQIQLQMIPVFTNVSAFDADGKPVLRSAIELTLKIHSSE